MRKYTSRILYRLLLLFSLFGLANCAGTPDRFYIPKAQPISAKKVLNPEFKAQRYINLENRASDEEVFIGAYTHDWWANYHRWTDAAIEMLQTELKNRGKIVNINAAAVFALGICTNIAGDITGTLYTDLKKTGCPLDTDQDGILDANDQCPETPKGISVNYKGCPPDTDGDGVPDYRDQCAGKPKEMKGINPTIEKEKQEVNEGKPSPDWWRFPDNNPECKTTYFSIAGQDPPDTVVQLIKTELEKKILSSPKPIPIYSLFSQPLKNGKRPTGSLRKALKTEICS